MPEYKRENYPQTPVFTKTKDAQGRNYFTAYSNSRGFACISIGKNGGEHNHVFEGNPKIRIRKGNSIFGDELVFELLINSKSYVTTKRTDYNTIEIYLPIEDGVEFLKKSVSFFETAN